MGWGWMIGCAVLSACAGGADEAGGSPPLAGAGGGGFAGAGGVFGGSGHGGFGGASGLGGSADAGLPPLPPEMELRADFELPRAGERFVFTANPLGDTVAVIDATTLRIQTVEAGDQPTFLQTLAGSDRAIVLNVGSDDATVIRASDSGIQRSSVPVVDGANAISVAPDGKHAIVYYDSAYTQAGSGSGSFQDVTVITIDDDTGDRAASLTVGFRPSAVFHQQDSTRSFVVTEDGVSILDYAAIDASGPGIAPTIGLGAGAGTQDISITPDGRYAMARSGGGATLQLIDIDTRATHTLELTDALLPTAVFDGGVGSDEEDAGVVAERPLPVTDLDLSPAGNMAFAVVRARSLVMALPIPEAFTDPTTIRTLEVPGQIVGSIAISADGAHGLLYTTADLGTEAVTLIDANDFATAPATIPLRKAVQAIAIAPDGRSALVVHSKAAGSPDEPGIDPDAMIDRSYGFSVIDFATRFAKLQVTETAVGPFSIVPDGSHLLLLFNTDNQRDVQRVNLRTFLVDSVTLGSRPVSIGAVEQSHKVFVSQEHPDGRITFIDWLAPTIASATQSVTGFELNSRIRE